MTKGIIIHLDNDEKLLSGSQHLFKQSELNTDFEYIPCKTRQEFEKVVEGNKGILRCLIFDLVGQGGKRELDEGNAEFLQYVNDSFAKFNIPIFIYSGYLELVADKFIDCGTLFKIEKGDKDQSINTIFAKIKLFHDSGFLDVFCPGGILENEIPKDIHESFVEQFRSGEIESVIELVQANDAAKCKQRCIEIFKRISIKALMSKLLSPVIEDKSTVNAIEHYYRRISAIDFWTGDILKKKNEETYIIILTPRCDCSDTQSFLVCSVEMELPNPNRKDRVKQLLTDNIREKKFRYIPSIAGFKGGKVDFSSYATKSRDELHSDYDIWKTLSDELTNEVLAKFGAYFLRTGISTIDIDELVSFLDSLNEP